MTSVCLVGGSGFIGSRLAARLQRSGVQFHILDKIGSTEFPDQSSIADARDLTSLLAGVEECDTIVNLAAEHRDDVRPLRLYEETNVGGAEAVCELARRQDIRRIVFTSSVAVYGFASTPLDEQAETNPFNEYGRTKLRAEAIYREWFAEAPDIRSLVIIRPTVVFGERNRGNVYNLLNSIDSDHFVMIGNGRNIKSMAYVENVAACLEFMCGAAPGEMTYNYVDKPDFNMSDLVSVVREELGRNGRRGIALPYWVGLLGGSAFDLLSWATGRNFPISAIRVKKFCADTVFNTSIDQSGFLPPTTLEAGLRRTLEFEFGQQ